MSDWLTERWIAIGKQADKEMAFAAIDKCNCMARYQETTLPAIRKGKQFYTPEGKPIMAPQSFEDMHPNAIRGIMASRGDQYIGHMFR